MKKGGQDATRETREGKEHYRQNHRERGEGHKEHWKRAQETVWQIKHIGFIYATLRGLIEGERNSWSNSMTF